MKEVTIVTGLVGKTSYAAAATLCGKFSFSADSDVYIVEQRKLLQTDLWKNECYADYQLALAYSYLESNVEGSCIIAAEIHAVTQRIEKFVEAGCKIILLKRPNEADLAAIWHNRYKMTGHWKSKGETLQVARDAARRHAGAYDALKAKLSRGALIRSVQSEDQGTVDLAKMLINPSISYAICQSSMEYHRKIGVTVNNKWS